jgi:hypothetical protein
MSNGLDGLLALLFLAAFGALRMTVVGIEVVARAQAQEAEAEDVCCVGKEEDCE